MSISPIRNASFDYARFAAVIGIIWFHTKAPYGGYGYAGLSFFLIVLVFMAIPQISQLRTTRHRAPAILRYAAARARRLIVPWLLACGLYGALKLAEVSHGSTWGAEFDTTMWLTGTALHLWFLPFAFVICLAVWPLGRWINAMQKSVQRHLCILFMSLSLVALAVWQTASLPVPVQQWAYAMPSILLGVALALTGGKVWRMVGVAALFFIMALSANWTIGLLQTGIATATLIACSIVSIRVTALSTFAAKASFGLYLIHPAVAALISRTHIIPEHSTAFALAVTLGSLAIVAGWETIKATQPLPRLIPQ